MKNKFFLLCAFYWISLSCDQQLITDTPVVTSAITWQANGGRLGDDLFSFIRAKWLAYIYNLLLFYPPFPYSDQLMLCEQENIYTQDIPASFSTIKLLPLKTQNYTINKNDNTLYVCRWKTIIYPNWSDMHFMQQLKTAIAPRQKLETISIPDNCISIAVHVRTGGNFAEDNQMLKETHPLRFTPEKILIAQVKRLIKMLNNEKNIYLHIFTDHPQPQKLIKKFKKQLNNPRITFGYREENNDHDMNVLEDFFSMMEFDCLVRPQSHFSLFAQRLGKSTIAIFPASVQKTDDGRSEIDVIIIQTRKNEHEAWITHDIISAKRFQESSYEE